MDKYPAGSITKNGVEVPIYVNSYGTWGADHAGRQLSADTRDKLADAIARATKLTTVKVAVPFIVATNREHTYDEGITVKRGTATGRHSSNGNVLVTWVRRGTEIKEQLTHVAPGETYFPGDMTDEQLEEFGQLCAAKTMAVRAHREFIKKHEIQLRDIVDKAIDEAQKD